MPRQNTTTRKSKSTTPQSYPRLPEDDAYAGFLDDAALQGHVTRISREQLDVMIAKAIAYANLKSSREMLDIPEDITPEMVEKIYVHEGRELFKYMVKYCGDPASTAYRCLNQTYSVIAEEQFYNRTRQKQRMNSGWRYQSLAKDAATASQRFTSVSDIGLKEADFNAKIKITNQLNELNLYVSVKNRSNTVGGQDMPKAIRALESEASADQNRAGPYLCVLGIAMESGLRVIRADKKSNSPYSVNTEMWFSDYFWPFFTNFSYTEIMEAVLAVLMTTQKPDQLNVPIPNQVIEAFGACCREHDLLDGDGKFKNALQLMQLFVSPPAIKNPNPLKRRTK